MEDVKRNAEYTEAQKEQMRRIAQEEFYAAYEEGRRQAQELKTSDLYVSRAGLLEVVAQDAPDGEPEAAPIVGVWEPWRGELYFITDRFGG